MSTSVFYNDSDTEFNGGKHIYIMMDNRRGGREWKCEVVCSDGG